MKKKPQMWLKIVSFDYQPEIATALGEIVAAWSYADTILLTLVFALMGSEKYNDIAVIYYSVSTFDGRVRLTKNLLRAGERLAKRPKAVSALWDAVEAVRGLSPTRDRYVHGPYAAKLDGSKTIQFDFSEPAGKQQRRKSVTVKEMANHADLVIKRTDDLLAALRKTFPEIPPAPRVGHPSQGGHKTALRPPRHFRLPVYEGPLDPELPFVSGED